MSRLLRLFLTWTFLGLALGLVAAIRLPALLGHPTLTVMSGSMEPALGVGDVVVEERISPSRAKLGDIVTFKDPEDPSRLITHRVVDMRVEDGVLRVTTRGDVNNAPEQWSTAPDGEIGRVLYRVPRAGYLVHWVRGPLGRMLLVVVPALLAAAWAMVRIWRPAREVADGA